MKRKLKDYINNNVEFLCELPSIIGKCNEHYIPESIINPFICPNRSQQRMTYDKLQVHQDIGECCVTAKQLTYRSHELGRKKAAKILTFLLSDSDREKSINGIDHVPVVYAMKGYSLTTATMRKMIEDVCDKCKEINADILCKVSDGQRIKNINHDTEGRPLTSLQFQKHILNNVLSMRK